MCTPKSVAKLEKEYTVSASLSPSTSAFQFALTRKPLTGKEVFKCVGDPDLSTNQP